MSGRENWPLKKQWQSWEQMGFPPLPDGGTAESHARKRCATHPQRAVRARGPVREKVEDLEGQGGGLLTGMQQAGRKLLFGTSDGKCFFRRIASAEK